MALKKLLAGGAPSDETAEAPEPLAVVATAGLPELALLALLDMIYKLGCLINQTWKTKRFETGKFFLT
jgi:hypothetical protein